MTQAPERIWATLNDSPLGPILQGTLATEKSEVAAQIEYTRADLAPNRAAFQQMREALEEMTDLARALTSKHVRINGQYVEVREAISRARAALKAAESAEPMVPLAAVAAAYGHIADVVDVTCDLTDACGYTAFARSMRGLVAGIRDAAPADATAALEAALKRARNEVLEKAADRAEGWPFDNLDIADAIRAMKEDV